MADNIPQLKRKERGSDSSLSHIEVKSPEEKKARDARSKAGSTSSSGYEILESLDMTHEFGKKIDLILSRLAAVDSKVELTNVAVKSLEEKLGMFKAEWKNSRKTSQRQSRPFKKCKMASNI